MQDKDPNQLTDEELQALVDLPLVKRVEFSPAHKLRVMEFVVGHELPGVTGEYVGDPVDTAKRTWCTPAPRKRLSRRDLPSDLRKELARESRPKSWQAILGRCR